MSEASEKLERDSLFGDPQHSLIAIFKQGSPVDKARAAVHAEGLGEEDVTVLDDRLDLGALEEDKGLLDGVRQIITYDEVDIERNYREAIRQGHSVLIFQLSSSEEGRMDQRNKIKDILFAHDAQYVHYFGESSFEEVMLESEDR